MKQYALIILLFLAIPGWIFLVLPRLPLYPSYFSMETQVSSVDNFYDEDKDDFLGEKTSKTVFNFRVEKKTDGVLKIKNTFEVSTLQGDKIFGVNRYYSIDSMTGQHVPGIGDREREGYLFAPKHLKKGQQFKYWHVNYDSPASMKFVGEEKLFGLAVYKYESRYENLNIDQTNNLTNLPGVGKTLGINLDPHLILWIEPVSGRLVKYQDETTAYYYNLITGKRLYPWNKFSNIVTDASVKSLVQKAYAAKATLILQEKVSPLLLALLGMLILLRSILIQKGHWLKVKDKLRLIKILSVFVMLTGILVIVGWGIDSIFLKSWIPGFATMKFPTALAFILAGINLYLLTKQSEDNQDIAELFLPISTFTLLLIMTTVVLSSVFGIKTGIENLFFQEISGAVKTVAQGSPSYGTMFNFLLIIVVGICGFLIKKRLPLIMTILGWVILSFGLVAFLGYVLNLPTLYFHFKDISTAMALHTAILFFLYGLSLITLGKITTMKNGSGIN